MTLTVEGALQLQVFTRTAVQVYAGQRNLDRPVRWVHPVEIYDIARFLTGGELLLTAGLGLGHTASEQRHYICEVSAAGAAALVVELSGRAFTTMPTALIDEAQQRNFPLIGLADEIPFVEVSAQVHELLADQNMANLVAFERLNNDFIQLLLASRSHISFTEALAHHVGFPVVLEDSDHLLVAYAGGTTETDELVKNWGLHARVRHQLDDSVQHLNRSIPSPPRGEPDCTRRRIVLRGEVWGWMHVFHGPAPVSAAHSYALDRAADAIAITLLGDRESGARASQRQNSLVNRLLLGDITGDQFVSRALKIGRDLRDRPLAVVVLCKEPDAENADALLETMLKPLRMPAVVADIGEQAIAVVGLTRQLSTRRLAEHFSTLATCAGVSRECSADQLNDAIRQARAAVSVAATSEGPATRHFDDLGVVRLLVALAEGPELQHYVDDELGLLLAHDAAEPNALLPTLRAYLDCDGNKSRAADALFVQRRTLYYRLTRLEDLLGVSLERFEVRAGLALALQALDFLESVDQTRQGVSTVRDLESRTAQVPTTGRRL